MDRETIRGPQMDIEVDTDSGQRSPNGSWFTPQSVEPYVNQIHGSGSGEDSGSSSGSGEDSDNDSENAAAPQPDIGAEVETKS
uniref:Uncharacterized protein n=1 Tax=Solanum tuberosum TaxID=4113 RepID=M1DRN8_SOLTU